MKTEIIKGLVKVANSLDQKGLYKESDLIDSLILKLASDSDRPEDFDKVVNFYRGKEYLYGDLQSAAYGGNEELTRGFPSWSRKDFVALCKELGCYEEDMEDEPEPDDDIGVGIGSRPSPTEIQDRANHILSMPHSFRSGVIRDMEEMAQGEDPEGMRKEYYPGWEDEDFQAVINLLKPSSKPPMTQLSSQPKKPMIPEQNRQDKIPEQNRQDKVKNKADEISSLPAMRRFSVISEMEEMAEGGDPEGMRGRYYPGWKNEEFQAVLNLLKSKR